MNNEHKNEADLHKENIELKQQLWNAQKELHNEKNISESLRIGASFYNSVISTIVICFLLKNTLGNMLNVSVFSVVITILLTIVIAIFVYVGFFLLGALVHFPFRNHSGKVHLLDGLWWHEDIKNTRYAKLFSFLLGALVAIIIYFKV